MFRTWLSPLLSLLTVVGGHLLNRRIDLVLLFFVLLLASSLSTFYVVPLVMPTEAISQEGVSAMFARIGYAFFAALAVLLLASVVSSFRLARRATALPPLTPSARVGGTLAMLLSVLTVFWFVSMIQQFMTYEPTGLDVTIEDDSADDAGPHYRHGSFFWESVRFSREWVDDDQLQPLPEGNAYLGGRVVYRGEGMAGVTLRAVLDGRYRSGRITSEAGGQFRIPVPEGEWTLNRIELLDWQGRPPNQDFHVTGGQEPALGEAMYYEGLLLNDDGLELTATNERNAPAQINLAIHDELQLLSPNEQKQPLDMTEDAIRWQPLEGAARYQLQLQRLERDTNSVSYHPVEWFNTSATDVPLQQFTTVSDHSGAEHEYAVQLFAFDKTGRLISQSENRMGEQSILLRGRRIVAREDRNALAGSSPAEYTRQLERRMQDKQRLQAARLLITEDMAESAATLLERIDSPSLAAETLTVRGMLLAARGQCDEARELYRSQELKRGQKCYPEFVSQQCGPL